MADGSRAPRKFVFSSQPSALSSMADKIWDTSKREFTSETRKPLVLEKKSLGDVLGKLNKQMKQEETTESASSFVFGSKIADRVAQPASEPLLAASSSTEGTVQTTPEKPKTSLAEQSGVSAECRADRLRAESEQAAAEAAAEHVRQLAATSIVKVATGEEQDTNRHQFNCKIHSYDQEKKAWTEKGTCLLRINQRKEDGDNHDSYRIVARTTGTMKVIINSPVYSDMMVERVDEKRVKISAFSPDQPDRPHIFLLTNSFSKTDGPAAQLLAALQEVKHLSKSAFSAAANGGDRKRKASEDLEEAAAKKEKESEEEDMKKEKDTEEEDKEDTSS